MSKDYRIDDFIIKELEKGGLTGKELRDRYKRLKNIEKPRDLKRSFGNKFHKLLFENIIQIDAYYNENRHKYDPEYDSGKISEAEYKKQIRNRTLEWFDLIYSLKRIEPVQIFQLIKQYSNDPTKINESYNELYKLFYEKLQEMINLNFQNWRLLLKNVEKRAPNDDEILYCESLKNLQEKIEKNPRMTDMYDNLEFNYILKSEIEELVSEISKLRSKYKNKNIFIYKDREKKIEASIDALTKIDYSDMEAWYDYNLAKSDPTPKSLNNQYYFYDKSQSKENFLEKLNYKIPILIEKTDVREIFDKLISYINKQETGQNSLFDELSWGLSAKKESLKILDELIYKATNKKMNDYLFKS